MPNIHTPDLNLAHEKMRAEIARLLTEARPIGFNTFFMPFITAAAVMGTTAAVIACLS
ncbi:hypothetical protein [Actibacterium sp. MT2.3-13A]|uniref:hypothetical protein n=1 Tax=Actibacterium sp. MT2.3-13A TaxID=2828332 RepID=UPI001BA88A22|nr:hypothetical protein [Actibacterium sp. MT2.3-13A]